MGFDARELTPTMVSKITVMAAEARSFQRATKLVDQMVGIRISPKTIERVVRDVGLELIDRRLFDGQRSTFGGVGPSVRWDVLNYGRLLNIVSVQDAQFQGLVYTYQQTELDAGREAEDAIVGFLRSQERARSLDASVNAAARTVEITFEQYRQGVVEFTAVFLAQSELARLQDLLAVADADVARSLIALYRALGGGWEMRLMEQSFSGMPNDENASLDMDQAIPKPEPDDAPPPPVTVAP